MSNGSIRLHSITSSCLLEYCKDLYISRVATLPPRLGNKFFVPLLFVGLDQNKETLGKKSRFNKRALEKFS